VRELRFKISEKAIDILEILPGMQPGRTSSVLPSEMGVS
jgi:hypothetical protein